MAVAVSVEPFRIGMTLMMLNRPRPASQLLAFLCGGCTMGLGVGLVVLFLVREALTEATHLTLPKVQIVIGVLALFVAAVLATDISVRRPERAPVAAAVGGDGAVVAEPAPPTNSRRLAARARELMQGSSLWVAWVAGMGIALPSIDYMAALAVILSSKTAPMTQAGALLAFNVVAFALVEIPLLSYLAAPDKTRAWMAALNDWIRSRRRRDVAALLAVAGCAMIAVGAIGLGA
jgi:Sap, sulfolipid-1-addressing protein